MRVGPESQLDLRPNQQTQTKDALPYDDVKKRSTLDVTALENGR